MPVLTASPNVYMPLLKTLITIIAKLTFSYSSTAQRQISSTYFEIKKELFDSCRKVSYLSVNTKIKKRSGKLTIPVSGKPSKVIKDDNSDDNFHEFEYIGDIKGTKLSIVKRTEYNTEEFYLINRSTGSTDTLIGLPVFAQNIQSFACINNPGSDEKQQIQVGEINNGAVKTTAYPDSKADTLIVGICYVSKSAIMAKDSNGKYWKLNF